MWILHLIPDNYLLIICHWLIVSGIIGLLVTWFVTIPKRNLLNVVFVLMLSFGLWIKSGYVVESEWKEKLRVAEEQVRIAEEKSNTVTEKIVTQYVERVKYIKEKNNAIKSQVKNTITEKSDNACSLSNSFVWLHDRASKNQIPYSTGRIDESPSGIKLSTVADTVIGNYGKYYEVSEQLKLLQQWIKDQKNTFSD